MSADPGTAFARALAARDRARLLDVLASDVQFRALTPGRSWTADDAVTAVDDIVLGAWFTDSIEALESVDTGDVADRGRVGYRLKVRDEGELYLCEQQAYYEVEDGRIRWLRVLCSGFRPYPENAASTVSG